ncbi:MAG: hypothetical protein IJ225_01555 [Solobacterium sp.]|nr:hypothetical protein [Solobacterium sp.]
MLRLELKKLIKTKRIMIILLFMMVLSVMVSYLPVTYERCVISDGEGTRELTGMAALKVLREEDQAVSGEVTPARMKEALSAYHTVLHDYGVDSVNDLPEGVYGEQLRRYRRFYHILREAYASSDSGIAPDLLELTEEEMDHFEQVRAERFESLMEQEHRPLAVRLEARRMYSQSSVPLRYAAYFNPNVLDYETLVFFLVMIASVLIAAPIFSLDYETGADDIQRCTVHGMERLVMVRCAAVVLLVSGMYLFAGTVFFGMTQLCYGREMMNSDIQTVISLFTCEPWTIGELMRNIALAGYVCVIATTMFTLMISSLSPSFGSSIGIALLGMFLPILLDTFISSSITDWLITLLPSCGLMLQKSFYYAVYTLSFLSAGKIAVASERAMTVFETIGIPLFAMLTLRYYRLHGKRA